MVTCIAFPQLIVLVCVAPFARLLNHNGLYSKQLIYIQLQGGQSVLDSRFASHRLHYPLAFTGYLQWTQVAQVMFLLMALLAVPAAIVFCALTAACDMSLAAGCARAAPAVGDSGFEETKAAELPRGERLKRYTYICIECLRASSSATMVFGHP
jgi:hypothetical protein